MKKVVKCLLAVGAVVGSIAGVLYFLDKKKNEDEFDDFDDAEFEDVFEDEEEDSRDYVTLDLEKEAEEEEQQ
ncbi:MAG: hypothetical protein HFH73_08840 [Lachnospiraceae bacterium]|jgi:hypothetical protein|nr:hypothetical protein [Lachnospiraceae bacterium]